MIGTIKYGEVELDCTRVNNIQRVVELSDDGVDYICTRVTVNVTAVWNPAATSYDRVDAAGVPQSGPAFAGRTDRMLFDYLSQPRRQLVLWTYDQDGSRRVYLESPALFRGRPLPSDARNGPVVKVFSVTETVGIKLFDVHLEITTWVNNCDEKESPILSHRWETTIDYDRDHFQVQTTRGQVIFNVGRLWQAGQTPDMYREAFMGVAPHVNFARDHVNVRVSSDNTRADYTISDVERPFSLGEKSPATRLEAMLTTWMEQGSGPEAAAQSAPTASAAFGSLVPGMGDLISPYNWLARNAQGAWGLSTTLAGNVSGQLPKYRASITCRAHGGRTSSRYDLARLCLGVAHHWLGPPDFFAAASRSEVILTQDVAGKFVELRLTLRWSDDLLVRLAGAVGPVGSLGVIFGRLFDTNRRPGEFLLSYFEDLETGQPWTENSPANGFEGASDLHLTQQPKGNRPLNTGQTAVGTPINPGSPYRWTRSPGSLQHVLTAALLGQCEVPASPPRYAGTPLPTPSNGRFRVPRGDSEPMRQG